MAGVQFGDYRRGEGSDWNFDEPHLVGALVPAGRSEGVAVLDELFLDQVGETVLVERSAQGGVGVVEDAELPRWKL